MGTRPRLACEVRAEGVVAARAEDARACSRQCRAWGWRASRAGGDGGYWDFGRAATVGGDAQGAGGGGARTRDVTLVVPDGAVRVLLLDFDCLPGKPAERCRSCGSG